MEYLTPVPDTPVQRAIRAVEKWRAHWQRIATTTHRAGAAPDAAAHAAAKQNHMFACRTIASLREPATITPSDLPSYMLAEPPEQVETAKPAEPDARFSPCGRTFSAKGQIFAVNDLGVGMLASAASDPELDAWSATARAKGMSRLTEVIAQEKASRRRERQAAAKSAPTAPADPREIAAREWDTDPSVRAGFSTRERYVAYRTSELQGRIRTYQRSA